MGVGVKAHMKLSRVAPSALALYAALALVLAATPAAAAPPERLLQSAGQAPTDAAASAAIIKYFEGKGRALVKRKPFRVISGPTLATGNTFGGSIEQAWLMCLVVNAERNSPGPQDIEGQTIYLRRVAGGAVVVVSTENWQDSSPQCDR